MSLSISHSGHRAITALALLIATVGTALAAEQQGPPRRSEPVEPRARAPRTAAQFRQLTTPPPVEHMARHATPVTAEDKGSLVTDAGSPNGPVTLAEHERAKLGAAREAVERAKAAGTRELRVPVKLQAEEPLEGIEARKQQELLTRLAAPRLVTPNPEAMPWLVKPPVQKPGVSPMTAAERAKAEAARTKAPAGPEAVANPPAARPERRQGGR